MAMLVAVCVGLTIPACTAQIRNGDRIATDPYLIYALPEHQSEEFQQLDPEDARATLGEPGTAAQWNDAAVLDARLQRIDQAETEFETAIHLAPTDPLAYANLARLYFLLGELDRVRDVYAKLATATGNGDALLARAMDLAGAGRLPEARLLMEALARPPVAALARPLSAATQNAPGSETRADLTPPAGEAALWLAADAMHALDYGRAREYYDQVLAVNALEPRALFGRGYISYLAEDWTAAARLLGLARTRGSVEPALPYYLTRALFQLERYPEALAIAETTRQPGLDLLAMHGRILLIMDYRADLTAVLSRARPEDHEQLRRLWYGDGELRELPELRSEFAFLY